MRHLTEEEWQQFGARLGDLCDKLAGGPVMTPDTRGTRERAVYDHLAKATRIALGLDDYDLLQLHALALGVGHKFSCDVRLYGASAQCNCRADYDE